MAILTFREGAYILLWCISTSAFTTSILGHLLPQLGFTSWGEIPTPPLWVAALATPLIFYSKSKYQLLYKTRLIGAYPGTVYAHRDPILGLDWVRDLSKAIKEYTILDVWRRAFDTTGDTFWVRSIGSWLIMTRDPENVKAFLGTDFKKWHTAGIGAESLKLTLGEHNILTLNGEAWHEARAMIRPSFVRNQIADLECTDRHMEKFLRLIPRDGSTFDLQDLIYRFTMDISTDFMFGQSTSTLDNPSQEALQFVQNMDEAFAISTRRARLGWIFTWMPNKELDRAVQACRDFVYQYLDEASSEQKAPERPYVFMNEILAAGAGREYVCDQLRTLILAGRDTSASTLSSLFFQLARRPDVVKKLRAEVAELGGRKPTWEELKGLKYLNMVLKEGLRLWAPVPSNTRMASVDTTLPRGGGPDGMQPVFVPKGTLCRWSSYLMHRRKETYGEDADEFRPERWETIRPTWEYLPFSGGPRICIGQQFALTQMLYLLARVFQEFGGVEAQDEKEPMTLQLTTTMRLVNGCWVRFEVD